MIFYFTRIAQLVREVVRSNKRVARSEKKDRFIDNDFKFAGENKVVQELAKGGPLPADAVGRIYEKAGDEMREWEARQGTPRARANAGNGGGGTPTAR